MPQPTAFCNQQPADLQRGNGSWPCYSYETSWKHGVCTGMWWRKILSILYLSNYVFSPFVPLWARRGWLLLPADQNFHTSRQRTCVCQRQIHPLHVLLLLHLLRLIVPPLLHPELPKHALSGQWWEVDLCVYEPIHIQKPSKVTWTYIHLHMWIYTGFILSSCLFNLKPTKWYTSGTYMHLYMWQVSQSNAGGRNTVLTWEKLQMCKPRNFLPPRYLLSTSRMRFQLPPQYFWPLHSLGNTGTCLRTPKQCRLYNLHSLQNTDPHISWNHQTVPAFHPEFQTSYTTFSGSSLGS